jgi:hypothetical protein
MCVICEIEKLYNINQCSLCDHYLCGRCGFQYDIELEDDGNAHDEEPMIAHSRVCSQQHSFNVCFTNVGYDRLYIKDEEEDSENDPTNLSFCVECICSFVKKSTGDKRYATDKELIQYNRHVRFD